MTADIKRAYGAMLVLIILGVLALFLGTRWFVVLIPVAIWVWYGAALKTGRNRLRG